MSSIPQFFPGLPDYPAITALRDFRQWVAWAWKKKPDGSFTKPPINPHTGFGASHSNPLQWGSYDEALARAQRDHLAGIGFVLEPGDDLTGSDLDDCRDPVSGSLEPWAAKIVALRETYTEVSPSGCGIRMMWKGKIESAIKCDPAHVEIYCRSRYLTITGQHVAGTPFEILPAPKTLAALRARVAEFREPDVMPSSASNGAAGQSGNSGRSDFRDINDRAMAELGAWVPYVFPRARFQPATRAWRVTSADLGRNLEEDLSLAPNGIVDFGVADIGDPRQGKRTPIDIVLEFGGAANVLDAAKWLADRVGGENPFTPDPVAAESQANLAARAPVAAPPQDEPEPDGDDENEDEGQSGPLATRLRLPELDALLFDADPLTPEALGGTLQLVGQECLEMARRPVPSHAALAAIMIGSTLFGRAWRGFTNTSLNLFTIIVGRSGQGKSWPPNAVRLLLNECGVGDRIGGRQPSSDSGLERRLKSSPVLTYCLDEAGKMFERLGSERAGNYERKIMDILLELWGQGTMPWAGKDAASQESHRGEDIIWYPTLSLIGATTIEPLFKAMNETNVRDGMFARLLFVSVNDRPDENVNTSDSFSPDLVDAVSEMWEKSLQKHKSRGNMAAASLRDALMRPPTEKVAATEEAKNLIRTIERWSNAVSEDDDAVNGIVNRSAESVVRLASIRALSRSPENPQANAGDVRWAWSIVSRSLTFVSEGIERHMAGSDFEALKKAMLRAIERTSEQGLPRWLLMKAPGVRHAEPRLQQAAIAGLLETREIQIVKRPIATVGRPSERYRMTPKKTKK